MERNDLSPSATTWVDPEDIALSTIRQTDNGDEHHVISLAHGTSQKQ